MASGGATLWINSYSWCLLMDITLSPEEEKYRSQVADDLKKLVKELPAWWYDHDVPGPEPDSADYIDFNVRWHKKLYQAGFIGITWPEKYGGRGGTLTQEVLFFDELARLHAPGIFNIHGIGWCGPALMRYGTEDQCLKLLPRILSCDDIWCTLYSETEAGSDVANVQTRAVIDGDTLVINGHKTWSSYAHVADWAVMLARTGSVESQHKGLSYLYLDMTSSGITVKPIHAMTGTSFFTDTYFDDVRVPRGQVLGNIDEGWKVLMNSLESERSIIVQASSRYNVFQGLLELTKKTGAFRDPLLRQHLAQLWIEVNAARCTGLRVLTGEEKGKAPGAADAIASLFTVDLNQRLQQYAMHLLGQYGVLGAGSAGAVENGRWLYNYLRSRSYTMETGTAQIKRNIIAQRTLGMPR